MIMEEKKSCVDCGVLNCQTRDKEYPEFCLTAELSEETIKKVRSLYEDEENRRVSIISAQIENEFYLRYTRVEETVEFAKRMGYKKIGIATCVGLIEESRILARILRKNGFEVYGAVCKIGSFLKELRKEKELTQEQLAETLSVSRRTVSRWETLSTGRP